MLIVEDEPGVAELFQDHLKELGHDVRVAGSAEEALRLLDTIPVDAILLDLGLPGLSGLQFLKLPAVRVRSIPIVVVSGAATEADALDCLRSGALDFVPKPVSPARLTEVIGFLELHVLNLRLAEQVRTLDRRRFPRVPAVFPVRVMEYSGSEWLGTCVDLSPFGMRLRAEASLPAGATVKLHFTPPDGPPSLTVLSVLVRPDPEGQAFSFVNLTKAEFQRMRTIVQAIGDRCR